MKILIVHNKMVSRSLFGGLQREVWYLVKELDRLGHQVTLLASRGTKSPFANVVDIDPFQSLDRQIPQDVDVVHFISITDVETDKPYVVTVYGDEKNFGDVSHNIYVSRIQAKCCGSLHYVYGGVDWDEFGDIDLNLRREYFHFVARKEHLGQDLGDAMRLIRSVDGARLKVLGRRRVGLDRGVRVTLSPRISFRGVVRSDDMPRLILRSKGGVFPQLCDGLYGLTLAESLYFGAPIFGRDCGALQEIVSDDFGFLTNDDGEMVRALKEANFSPQRCHQYASDCFNSHVMALQYLKKYELVMEHKTLI